MNRINLNIIDFNNKQLELIPNPSTPKEQNLVKITINGITYGIAGTSARVFENIEAMVTAMNALAKEDLQVGSNIYISTVDVPDLWVSKNDETTSVPYTYTTDAAFIEALNQAGESGLQLGYYRINKLEGEKVVIPIASSTVLGVSKGTANYGITYNTSGFAVINKSTDAEIEAKTQQYKPIVPSNLDKAIMEGLGNYNLGVDNVNAWSDAYKAHARQVLGISSEQWTATLTDGTTVTKNVLLL